MSISSPIGYLTWWTVPELAAPYSALDNLAAQSGFPPDGVPAPPSPRHGWEKATALGGARGLRLDPPVDLRYQTFVRYGVDPILRLLTRRVSAHAPLLRRHLVREVVIPRSHQHDKQLSLHTVAVLEFDCTIAVAHSYPVPDPEGWIDGHLPTLLADLQTRQHALQTEADGQDVRQGIRKLLLRLYRVSLRGSGRVYFVPASAPDAAPLLHALRAYIAGLRPWKIGRREPLCQVVTWRGDEAHMVELRQDILASAVETFKRQLQAVADQVAPVLAGTAKSKPADRLAQSARENLLEVQAAIQVYQDSLQDNLQALHDMLHMTQAAVLQAAAAESDPTRPGQMVCPGFLL